MRKRKLEKKLVFDEKSLVFVIFVVEEEMETIGCYTFWEEVYIVQSRFRPHGV